MAGRKINFFDDDDEDEQQYIPDSRAKPEYGRGIGNMQTRMTASKDRTIESQQRALRSIAHSEEVGVATAAELVRQGEILDQADTKLDSIAAMQDQSDRHINNLSSIFGPIWNKFSRKKSGQSAQPSRGDSSSRNELINQTGNQPTALESRIDSIETNTKKTASQQYSNSKDARDREIDDNLHLMGDGVSRLKSLASGLGSEIETQNQTLDRMQPKVERVNTRMASQQDSLNRLLYGKK